MKLLLEQARREADDCESLRCDALKTLRGALEQFVPGGVVWVYGSITTRGRFSRYSDIDIAFEWLPAGKSLFGLQSVLSAACGREVDVCMLEETRLEPKIREWGERWTL